MPTLAQQINQPGKRQTLIRELAQLVDTEVGKKGGLSGIGIKTAYALVKAIKPSFITEVVDAIYDECIERLEPIYAKVIGEEGGTVAARLQRRSGEVADALLGVTDGRVRKSSHGTVKKTYEKLRPSARKHVEEAVPGLADILQRHTSA
jgi:hypothetical protein